MASQTQNSIARLHVQALKAALQESREALEAGLLDPLVADPALRAELLELGDDAHDLAAALHAHVATARQPVAEQRARGLRIVAVDDDGAAVRAIAELLAPEFDVRATTDPNLAIRYARDGAEAVVCDLHMPGLDGFGLLRVLQGDPRTAATPCLVISGSADNAEKLRAFDAGACDYLPKPLSVDELAARLRAAIGRGRELARERRLQQTDELTGLSNRRGFRAFLVDALRAAQATGRTLALAMIDQDGLKPINDRWGHAVGDQALRLVAATLARVKRDADCAARLGGDEFALAMPGADLAGARRLLNRVERELAEAPLNLPDGTRIVLRVSAGAACSQPDDDPHGEALLERADSALYEVKRIRTELGLAGRTPTGSFNMVVHPEHFPSGEPER